MSRPTPREPRRKRVLARPLIQGGVRREPGDTVEISLDQMAQMESDGYFEPLPPPAPVDKGGKSQ